MPNEDKESLLKGYKELILKGEVRALSIDSSTFRTYGCRLESGVLRQLGQFRGSAINLVVSDVVRSEVIRYLADLLTEVKRDVDGALNRAIDHWRYDQRAAAVVKEKIFKGDEPAALAHTRFATFEEEAGVSIVEADNSVKISELMQRYFKELPPFSAGGKKKYEFPDAVALLALEAWAISHETKAIVCSTDNDWKSFCKQSPSLLHVEDLGDALGLFQLEEAKDICKHLSQRYKIGELGDLSDSLDEALDAELDATEFYPEASSSFGFRLDYSFVPSRGAFTLEPIDSEGSLFQPINFDGSELVVVASMEVMVTIESIFQFNTYDSVDREEISLGSGSCAVETPLSLRAVITLSGNLQSIGGEVDVEEVEVSLESSTSFECGEIEPDWLTQE